MAPTLILWYYLVLEFSAVFGAGGKGDAAAAVGKSVVWLDELRVLTDDGAGWGFWAFNVLGISIGGTRSTFTVLIKFNLLLILVAGILMEVTFQWLDFTRREGLGITLRRRGIGCGCRPINGQISSGLILWLSAGICRTGHLTGFFENRHFG